MEDDGNFQKQRRNLIWTSFALFLTLLGIIEPVEKIGSIVFIENSVKWILLFLWIYFSVRYFTYFNVERKGTGKGIGNLTDVPEVDQMDAFKAEFHSLWKKFRDPLIVKKNREDLNNLLQDKDSALSKKLNNEYQEEVEEHQPEFSMFEGSVSSKQIWIGEISCSRKKWSGETDEIISFPLIGKQGAHYICSATIVNNMIIHGEPMPTEHTHTSRYDEQNIASKLSIYRLGIKAFFLALCTRPAFAEFYTPFFIVALVMIALGLRGQGIIPLS